VGYFSGLRMLECEPLNEEYTPWSPEFASAMASTSSLKTIDVAVESTRGSIFKFGELAVAASTTSIGKDRLPIPL